MSLFITISPKFNQDEQGKVTLTNRVLDVIESRKAEMKAKGEKYDKLKELQSLVSLGEQRSLIEPFAGFMIGELRIVALVHEEGAYLGESGFSKAMNLDPVEEDEMKWLPWNTGLPSVERPVFGNILFVKDTGKEYQSFEPEEVQTVLDAIQERTLELI